VPSSTATAGPTSTTDPPPRRTRRRTTGTSPARGRGGRADSVRAISAATRGARPWCPTRRRPTVRLSGLTWGTDQGGLAGQPAGHDRPHPSGTPTAPPGAGQPGHIELTPVPASIGRALPVRTCVGRLAAPAAGVSRNAPPGDH